MIARAPIRRLAALALVSLAFVSLALAAAALAQEERGTLAPRPLPPLANPSDPALPAKELFGRARAGAPMAARAIGAFARGCVAGAVALPVDGETWQAMRLSRNRNWGHPNMIAFLERFAKLAPKEAGWRGLLVGDISQPRGGPMLTGHASHQIGLDADIWLTPMPDRRLTPQEREDMSAINVVASDWNDIDPAVWTRAHTAVLRLAARQPEVSRVLINPAIKRALCREAGPTDRAWLQKVRPWWGHNYHFHIRIRCPADSPDCAEQDAVPPGDGCGPELAWWFTDEARNPKPSPPRPPVTLADLPATCRQVLVAR